VVAGEEVAASAFADEVPTLPQHSGFGSVWDSQIGVAPPAAGGVGDVEGLEDEPEVPEYLLAERRQQGRRRGTGGGRVRGGSAGYRSAIDRERFGAGGGAAGYRDRSGGRGGQVSQPRWSGEPAQQPVRRTPSAEPWSEVPPEVQELLRAEVSRRQGAPPATPTPVASATPARPTSRTGSRRRSSSDADPAEATATEAAAPAAEKPRRTTTRRKAASADAAEATATEAAAPAAEKPRRTTTRRKAASADAAEATATATEAAAPAAEKPRTTTRRKAATAESSGADES
jgi:hypothetical protein